MTERKVSSEGVSEDSTATVLRQILDLVDDVSAGSDPDEALERLHALLALRSSVKTEIRIKPLEWERVTESPVFHGDETKRFWKATNPFGGSCWINVHTEDFEGEASWGGKKYPNSAAAMNAVEDHLRACALSAIEAPAAASEVTEVEKVKSEAIDGLLTADDVWEDYGSGFRIHFSFLPGSDMSVVERIHTARDITSALKGDHS